MDNSSNNVSQSLEIIDILPQSTVLQGKWSPVVREETLALLQNLDLPDQESRDRLQNEAVAVLSRCFPPTSVQGTETGLVIGYVQSGKTMSFTTVAALARDNGFPLVIVIAGTSIPLFDQSEDRLKKDLRLYQRDDRKWKYFSNPKTNLRQTIESTLAEWSDPTVPDAAKQTVLITVMKHHTHLKHLNKLLATMKLEKVPVLVIDDEADQAGLNAAVNKGEQSTTYRSLVELRQKLPHHTFLQYTATPQAPLLINLIDVLSPKFAELLTPGAAYTGGKEFFTGGIPELVQIIPASDIPLKNNPLFSPPDSLLLAMRLFYLGVAAGYVANEPPKGNRSMMVHPSQKTLPHAEYKNWVDQAQKMWLDVLKLEVQDPDRQDLLSEFYEAYKDLSKTVPDLPAFDELVAKLQRAIRNTHIIEINSTPKTGTPQIDWKNDYAHILVGGQAMDRGFTVEGLTITYMPRGIGGGNADTIQQRARFFGYKKGYLGYCRVFVETATRDAFAAYVTHEEDIRTRLSDHRLTQKPLSEWKRAFFLDNRLRPTRTNVLDLPYIKDNYSDKWFMPTAPHDAEDAVVSNRLTVQQFLANLSLTPDQGHPDRTLTQRHLVTDTVPLAEAFSKLLLPLRVTRPNDSQYFTGLMLQIKRYLESNLSATCTVYLMSSGKERERSVDAQDTLINLFQGAHPDTKGTIYRGDRYIRNNNQLTIQIHNLKVITEEQEYKDVPAIAVWVPKSMSNPWLSQNQGNT